MIYEYKGTSADIEVCGFGGMITVRFHTGERDVSPLFERDWERSEDAFMNYLRGDFFSTPFGANPEDFSRFPSAWRELEKPFDREANFLHGYGAHHCWKLKEWLKNGLVMEISYPEDEMIEGVTRRITASEEVCRVDFLDEITIRKDGWLPLGLHPIFKLSGQEGMTELTLPDCQGIRTYPVPADESSIFVPDQWVRDVRRVPLKKGGTVDALRLPLAERTEELLLLCNVEKPEVTLHNKEEDYRVRLTWDGALLKHCLLWMCNRGNRARPWNGDTLCLGVEPIMAAFDLGEVISAGENPLKKEGMCTCVKVGQGEVLSLFHRMELLEGR